MSVINNALSELADKDNSKAASLTRAEIPKVPHSSRLAWALGGFTLSLCFGGWAVSWQTEKTQTQEAQLESRSVTLSVEQLKPLNKFEPEAVIATVFSTETDFSTEADIPTETTMAVRTAASSGSAESGTTKAVRQAETKGGAKTGTDQPGAIRKEQQTTPLLLAQNKLAPNKTAATEQPVSQGKSEAVEQGAMMVQQVELTPEQLEKNAIQRAEKALDANNLEEAIEAYEIALKYRPENETSRKKLAALYYGKNDSRSAAEVLQRGIKRNKESQSLRLALSKLLIKENQPEAALSPLVYLPEAPQVDYLAMRAALAQQNKKSDIALETYQMLTDREEDNARWWLGLAIQQERKTMYPQAKSSYKKALGRIGVSKKTQTFIRDRLSLLEKLEEKPNAKD